MNSVSLTYVEFSRVKKTILFITFRVKHMHAFQNISVCESVCVYVCMCVCGSQKCVPVFFANVCVCAYVSLSTLRVSCVLVYVYVSPWTLRVS